jgi:predicted small secreted protein
MFSPRRIIPLIAILALTSVLLTACAKTGTPPGKKADITKTSITLVSLSVEDSTHLTLTFGGALKAEEAQKKENYLIQDRDGNPLPVLAVICNRPEIVTVITAPQKSGETYFFKFLNLRDANGALLASTQNFKFTGSGKGDVTPPALVSSYPAHQQKEIGILSPLTLTFSDLMKKESLAPAIEMEDDLGEKIDFSLQGEGTRFLIIPQKAYDYSTTYSVHIHTTAADISGNPLYREELVQFTTITDSSAGEIDGTVSSLFGDIAPENTRIWLSDSPDPNAYSQIIYAQTSVKEFNPQDYPLGVSPPPAGYFSFTGLAPTGKDLPGYYLHAAKDQNGDGVEEYLGGLGSKGEVTSLSLNPGEKHHNLVVTILEQDTIGPKILRAWAEPNPLLYGDAIVLKCLVSDRGTGDSSIKKVEAFPGELGSHGTGIELSPTLGKLGEGSQAAVSVYIFNLSKFGLKPKKDLPVFIQAQDDNGNWGEVSRVQVSLQKPKSVAYLQGSAILEEKALPQAIVVAMDTDTSQVVSITVADDKGDFRLLVPPNKELNVIAFDDANKNHQLDSGEARAELKTSAPASNLLLRLMFVPSFSFANARLSHYGAFEQELESWELFLWALVSDDDYDLNSVTAQLPDGRELELNDEGREGDKTAGDGIYSLKLKLESEDLPVIGSIEEGLTLTADDKAGNSVTVGSAEFPGLELINLPLVTNINAQDDGSQVNVSWQGVDFPQKASYAIFIVPKSALAQFTGPGTSEVWSNLERPTRLTAISIDRAKISGWWSTPTGTRYVVAVAVLGEDTHKALDMDKSWAFYELVRK